MSRSRLPKLLTIAYRILQQSQKTGIPTNELLGMRQEARITRRRLLQGGLGLGGALALNALHQNQSVIAQTETAPVLIVGAGIAGLTAAYRLQKANVPVNIIEARSRVGGRINTLKGALGTRVPVELGAEFINSDHTHLLALAEELGLEKIDMAAEDNQLSETYYIDGRLVPMEEIVEQFAPVAERIATDLEIIKNFQSYKTTDVPTTDLDRISLAEYVERLDTSTMIRKIVDAIYTPEYGIDIGEQSSLNLLYLMGQKPGEIESIEGNNEERYYLKGGNSNLTAKLAEMMGDSLETQTMLESIRSLPDGRYRVSLLTPNNVSVERTYERVILAIPFSVLRKIDLRVDLPAQKRAAIEKLGYGTNAKVVTRYQSKIWRDVHKSSGVSISDLGYQVTWESAQSRLEPDVALLTNFTGGSQAMKISLNSASLSQQWLEPQLEKVFPGLKEAFIPDRVTQIHWATSPYSRGSYSCYRIGQWTLFYGIEGERVGNLFFAGEHTSPQYAAYMEGGCESGERVALEILEDLGMKSSAAKLRQQMALNRKARHPISRRPLAGSWA